MKLVCNVSIGNRSLPGLAINPKRKHVKSTMALCKYPKSSLYCVILFTAQNKSGTKYDLKENIMKVLTRFVSEGKATVQFKQPPHDIFIQADTIQLKCFLKLLKYAVENKISESELTSCYSSMSVTAVSTKNIAPTKLIITKRSEYPAKGFPRTLEILHINDIHRCSLDLGILKLMKLKVLNLSGNDIEYLPTDVNKLPLSELDLSHNHFGKSSPKQWMWIGGVFCKTLKLLNLSYNELKFIPENIVKLHNLITLSIDNNELTMLPSGIGNLTDLRTLSASNNKISSLPGSVKKWGLDSIDLSSNTFEQLQPNETAMELRKPLPICSLKEYAARKVLRDRLYYSAECLPLTVMHYLDLGKYCVCGKACFDVFMKRQFMMRLSTIAKSHTTSLHGLSYVPIDCYFCSLMCLASTNYIRGRIPVIR